MEEWGCRGVDDMIRCWAWRGDGHCRVVGIVGRLVLSVKTWVLQRCTCPVRVDAEWKKRMAATV